MTTDTTVAAIAGTLLGVAGIRLWHDQLLWKPPASGSRGSIGWHQDKGYWGATNTTDMVTAWIALDDVATDCGPMRFVDGSHRWGLVDGGNFFSTDTAAQRDAMSSPGRAWREVPAEMRAGQVSFHHCLTIHGSGANTSPRPRVSLAVHLMANDARRVAAQPHDNHDLATEVADGAVWRGDAFPELWVSESTRTSTSRSPHGDL